MKKKLLICITSLTGGGAEKSLINFVHTFQEILDISILVYTEKNNFYASKLEHLKVDYVIKKDTPIFIEKILNKMFKFFPADLINKWIMNRSIFKNEKFDYEFSYLEGKSTKIIAGSTNKDSYKLAYIHCDFSKNWYSKRSFKNYSEELKCYKQFNSILAVSNQQKESFEAVFPGTSLDVIPNLINLNEIQKLSSEELVDQKSPFFCAVGRLETVKNFELLINAFHWFRKKHPEYQLIILGEGSLFSTLNDQILKLNEENNIKLIGFQDNPYKYMKNSCGVIQTSVSESFSYVLAEAAMLGVPTLSTKTQGSKFMGEYFNVIEVEHSIPEVANGMEKLIHLKMSAIELDFNENAIDKFKKIFLRSEE